MTKLAIWLLHAYLIVFPLSFMAIFVGYGFMMTHAAPATWLLDLLLPALVALTVAWAMLKLVGRVTHDLVLGRRWAQAFVVGEMLAALALGGYLVWLATPISIALGVLGGLAAMGGGIGLVKRSEA